MRVVPLLGVILIVGGAVLLWRRPTYSTRRDVVEIGDFKASMQQQENVPLWIGGVLIAGGVVCLLAGAARGRR